MVNRFGTPSTSAAGPSRRAAGKNVVYTVNFIGNISVSCAKTVRSSPASWNCSLAGGERVLALDGRARLRSSSSLTHCLELQHLLLSQRVRVQRCKQATLDYRGLHESVVCALVWRPGQARR